MITTVKVLGLRARDLADLRAAAQRVVEYVQGAPLHPPSGAGTIAYYAGQSAHAPVAGQARGAAAALVGLSGRVRPEQLQRLLLGRHTLTGLPLVPVRGSAGRSGLSGAHSPKLDAAPEVLTLPQAARIAGVSPSYLRRLAEESELEAATSSTPDTPDPHAAGGLAAGAGEDRDVLHATRDPTGRRWLVTRAELGRFMTDRQPPTVVIGYDVTASAPKSVSLLWAFGDDMLRTDITSALDAGIDAALAFLERHASVGTVAGRNRPGLGLAVASYRHEISRSEEAHLHVHNIVANAVPVPVLDEQGGPVLDGDGVAQVEWRALDSEVFLRHVKTAGFIGAAALRHELARRRGLEWGPVRNGVAELAAFPPELLEAFSTRTGEVSEEFLQLVEAGFNADAGTKAAAQRGSRAAKRVLSDPEVEAIQARRLAEAGWDAASLRALAEPRAREVEPPTAAEISGLCDVLCGPTGLAEQQPLFGQREVHQKVAAWAGDRLDADAVADVARRVMADPRLVRIQAPGKRRRNQSEDTYTTTELLEVEDALLALYRQGRQDHGGPPRAPVTPAHAEAAIEAISTQLRDHSGDPRAALSHEQADLVRGLLASGDLVRPVKGPAGTGKTEAMRALVQAYTAAGHTVLATANGGRQTEELATRLQVRAEVVTSWLTRFEHASDPHRVWAPGTVVIVDEATQISTRHAEALLRHATGTGTVLILVGDPAQLGSVGASGWYRHLLATAPGHRRVPGLTVNQRQTSPDLEQVRAALNALRQELPIADMAALNALARDGRLVVCETREDMLAAIVEDWHTGRTTTSDAPTQQTLEPGMPGGARVESGPSAAELAGRSRMMAEHHRDAELLNQGARALLHREGALSGPELRVGGREFQAGDEVITLTQAGHTLVPAGRPATAYIRTGTLGVITHVHPSIEHTLPASAAVQSTRPALSVFFPDRGEVTVPWEYLTHTFADGRDGALAHAYAVTAHKAEGTTMDTARAEITDDTSRAGLYVMLSRARDDLRGYLLRRRHLDADLDDETWLPVLNDNTGPLRAVLDHLAGSRTERLATEHDATAHAAHRLTRTHALPELTRMRRQALTHLSQPAHPDRPDRPGWGQKVGSGPADRPGEGSPVIAGEPSPEHVTLPSEPERREREPRPETGLTTGPGAGVVSALVIRRAELAAESRIIRAALADPEPGLLARIGARPTGGGPDLSVWEAAVAAVAVYSARYSPQASPDRLPDAAPAPSPDENTWSEHRAQAEDITAAWAALLPPAIQRRFHSQAEQVPRTRAIASIHALLATGHTPTEIRRTLTSTPTEGLNSEFTGAPGEDLRDIRTGAAVLDYRVHALLQAAELEEAAPLFELPAPWSHHQEWQQAQHRHAQAQARHLAHAPTADLAGELHQLTGLLTTPPLSPEQQRKLRPDLEQQHTQSSATLHRAQRVHQEARDTLTSLRLAHATRPAVLHRADTAEAHARQQFADASHRHDVAQNRLDALDGDPQARRRAGQRRALVEAALAHQIDAAAAKITQHPPAYLTGLLGERPDHPEQAARWQRHAVAVEHYRHHYLGLPYATPAAADTEPASHQALGEPPHDPSDPDILLRYQQLASIQATFDLSL